MAEIILAVNFHPNETLVTGFYAKELKKRLRNRGYEVKIIGIPQKHTLQKIAEEAYKENRKIRIPDAEDLTEEYLKEEIIAKHPNAVIADLHCRQIRKEDLRRPKQYRKARLSYDRIDIKKPSRMDARSTSYFNAVPFHADAKGSENFLIQKDTRYKNSYAIEVPAIFVPQDKKISQLTKAIKKHPESPLERDNAYLKYKADLKATKASNILNPRNIDKIAHALDADIKTWQAKHRLPRGMPHMGRKSARNRNRKPHGDILNIEAGRRIKTRRA